ncbi:MAG: hypothetical protein M1834_002601 [Cirrosporium novae-zelandiae]|nr:MAG: hypothetical protein M1834_002601 [Cirrosporium novae-zelandiae]
MSTASETSDDDRSLIGPFEQRRSTFRTGAQAQEATKGIEAIIRKKLPLKKKSNYKYEPIKAHEEMRILTVFAGKSEDELECMLYKSKLPSTPNQISSSTLPLSPYYALSYWWGDDYPKNKIKIYDDTGARGPTHGVADSFNSWGTFYIRDNLKAALQQYRQGNKNRDIWIDVICINQDDKDERAAQVSRMQDIYIEAQNVWIWLGAGEPTTKETFDFLKEEILDLRRLDGLIKDKSTSEKWRLVINLIRIKWFSRRWVVQELALAKRATVRWGTEEMDWANFAEAIALFMTRYDEIRRIIIRSEKKQQGVPNDSVAALEARRLGVNTLVNATSNLFRKDENGVIRQRLLTLEVLVSSWLLAFEASDPRDTVYAVLSLAKDTSSTTSELVARTSWTMPKDNGFCLTKFGEVVLDWVLKPVLFKPILWLLTVSENHNATLPDTVSSNIVPTDTRILPDYNRSLADVCAGFMEYCIERSKSLDILCRHWAPPERELTPLEKIEREDNQLNETTMPTWIPSIKEHAFGEPLGVLLGRHNGDSLVGSLERQNQQNYDASAGLSAHVKFGKYNIPGVLKAKITKEINITSLNTIPDPGAPSPDYSARYSIPQQVQYDGTLHVKGFRLDRIKSSYQVLNGVIDGKALALGGWPRQCNKKQVPDQLWKTLVADRGPNGTITPTWYRRACLECLAKVDVNGNLSTKELLTNEHTPRQMVSFLERTTRVIWNRKFFSSFDDRRYTFFGLGPSKTKNGDVICILFGCSVPVLLREKRLQNGNLYFKFVGECYVHGMMDGEAIPAQRPVYPYDKQETFELR